MKRRVFVVAGEPSGDRHAAALVRAARAADPELAFYGIGGPALRAAGMEVRRDCGDMAVMGLTEVLRKYGFFRRVFRETVADLRATRPDALLLVDYPGFNLRLASAARRLGLRVVYYICPQVWAWNRRRVGEMARRVDRLLTILPFEAEIFADSGLRAEYVGHPLAAATAALRAAAPPPPPWPGAPRVALLPGSRRQEIEHILPVLLEAARRLEAARPGVGFLIAAADDAAAAQIAGLRARLPGPARLQTLTGRAEQILCRADAAWVASGTATLEAALLDCPTVLVYRTSWLTYQAARRLIRVPHIGLVNLIRGRRVCPELVQGEATPDRLVAALTPLLDETPERQAMRAEFDALRAQLDGPDPARRAAAALQDELAR